MTQAVRQPGQLTSRFIASPSSANLNVKNSGLLHRGQLKFRPPTVIQMVRVGEETGALERFLGEAADFYENELEYRLANAIQLLEPAMLLAVGGVIGFVAISMVSAIYSLTSAIR